MIILSVLDRDVEADLLDSPTVEKDKLRACPCRAPRIALACAAFPKSLLGDTDLVRVSGDFTGKDVSGSKGGKKPVGGAVHGCTGGVEAVVGTEC